MEPTTRQLKREASLTYTPSTGPQVLATEVFRAVVTCESHLGCPEGGQCGPTVTGPFTRVCPAPERLAQAVQAPAERVLSEHTNAISAPGADTGQRAQAWTSRQDTCSRSSSGTLPLKVAL